MLTDEEVDEIWARMMADGQHPPQALKSEVRQAIILADTLIENALATLVSVLPANYRGAGAAAQRLRVAVLAFAARKRIGDDLRQQFRQGSGEVPGVPGGGGIDVGGK